MDIGQLLLSIGLDTSQFRQGLNKVDDDIKKFSKQAKNSFKFFGAAVAFNFLGNIDQKLQKSANAYQKIGGITKDSVANFHQLVVEGEKLKNSFTSLFVNLGAAIQPAASALIVAAKEFFNYISKGYGLINELATKGVVTPDQPSYLQTDSASAIKGAMSLKKAAIGSGINSTKSIGSGISMLTQGAIGAAAELVKFKESLEKAKGTLSNMVDDLLKSNRDSKTNDELSRILKDRLKNPWQLTEDQIKSNNSRKSYRQMLSDSAKKRGARGFDEDFINNPLYKEQRPDTTQFDSTILKAFDLIQADAVKNKDQINNLLKAADKLAKGIGQFGAVDELRKAQQQRAEGVDKAQKLVVEVYASRDFEIRVAASSAIKAAIKRGVTDAIVNEAGLAASGAIQ